MRFGHTTRTCFAFGVVACASAAAALAADVPPGGFRSGRNDEDDVYPLPTEWPGELLAERSVPFAFVGDPYDDGVAPFSRGTFTSRVHRDAETGGLSFVYLLDETSHFGVNDLEHVWIDSFGTFSTDSYFSSDEHGVARSADGATLLYSFNVEDVEGTFLVRTNADAFSAGGTFRVEMDFEPALGERTATFAAYAPLPEPAAGGWIAAAGAALLCRHRPPK
jgi:hypothetical protein